MCHADRRVRGEALRRGEHGPPTDRRAPVVPKQMRRAVGGRTIELRGGVGKGDDVGRQRVEVVALARLAGGRIPAQVRREHPVISREHRHQLAPGVREVREPMQQDQPRGVLRAGDHVVHPQRARRGLELDEGVLPATRQLTERAIGRVHRPRRPGARARPGTRRGHERREQPAQLRRGKRHRGLVPRPGIAARRCGGPTAIVAGGRARP